MSLGKASSTSKNIIKTDIKEVSQKCIYILRKENSVNSDKDVVKKNTFFIKKNI
jgi:hypothetical protein